MTAKKKELSGYEKAAILLLSLGEEVASTVFSKLDEYEVRKLSNTMATLEGVTPEQRDEVMEEFSTKADEVSLLSGGDEFVKQTLLKSLGEEKGKEIIKGLQGEGGALSDIKHLHPKTLAQFIRNEHPQTIAMIMAHLDPMKSSEVLNHFPQALKKDVIIRIATLEHVSPEAIDEVEEVLRREIKSLGNQYEEKIGGPQTAAEIMNQMDKSSEEFIFEKLEEEDADLATSIKELMFVFEDINKIDARGIQAMLKEVNNEQLTLALKTASDELKNKILENMSERAAGMLKDDMEVMGAVKLSDVEKAQQAIVNITRKLADQGKIVIAGKGSEDALV